MIPGPRERLSFLMGADAIADDELTGLGIGIVRGARSAFRSLLIPDESLPAYRDLLRRKLAPGFWNDVVGRSEILFVFKLADGTVTELALTESTRPEIARLCSSLNRDPIEKTSDVPRFLAGNPFYRETIEAFHGAGKGARMADAGAVALEVATRDCAPLLANLLELYAHDMSEFFPVEIGADGRFGYPGLPLYWSEPETRFPFLIRSGGKPAGFVLATRGSPATDDPQDLDVAEFFVLRRHRRSGVGRRAALLLWSRLPGRWVVRVSEANRAGLAFWRTTIDRLTRGAFSESTRRGAPHGWRVFVFSSTGSEAPV